MYISPTYIYIYDQSKKNILKKRKGEGGGVRGGSLEEGKTAPNYNENHQERYNKNRSGS